MPWTCVFPGTPSAVKLEALVNEKSLCKDIAMLSDEHQTSRIEAFHSLIVQSAPKTYDCVLLHGNAVQVGMGTLYLTIL